MARMNNDLPEPLTPAYCILRGNDWMPLHGHKLYNSEFDAHANDAEFRAAHKLWWFAWNEAPAASVPDDDAVLCKAAGFGRDMKAWLKVKKMALHGFVKCSDGRLYHRFQADEAVKSYELRLKSDRKREADRERLKNWREARDATEKETLAEQQRNTAGNTQGNVGETRFVAGRQDRTGQDKTKQEAKQPCSQTAREPRSPARSDPPDRWAPLATGWEVDRIGVKRPTRAGEYLDLFANRVLEAARINDANWRGDWRPITEWLDAGIDAELIVQTVRACAERPKYEPPRTLKYFDGAIREAAGLAAAA